MHWVVRVEMIVFELRIVHHFPRMVLPLPAYAPFLRLKEIKNLNRFLIIIINWYANIHNANEKKIGVFLEAKDLIWSCFTDLRVFNFMIDSNINLHKVWIHKKNSQSEILRKMFLTLRYLNVPSQKCSFSLSVLFNKTKCKLNH